MKRFKKGDWVIVQDGRCGCVHWTYLETGTATVQFSADGRCEDHQMKTMRWASSKESEVAQGRD